MDLNLGGILREERKSKLRGLEAGFYAKASERLRELEAERKKIDPDSPKTEILNEEIKKTRRSIESIIDKRLGKILKLAALNASAESTRIEELGLMTPEEQPLYNELARVIGGWRSSLVGTVLGGREHASEPAAARAQAEAQAEATEPEKGEKSEGQPAGEKVVQREAVSKRDISMEYVVARVLKDLPMFMGADGRNYTLSAEDVAVLPAVNATALCNRKAAIAVNIDERKIQDKRC
ncbi:MAG TPA: hypothetical protein HA257_09160 [Candidatus Methanoperedenaceae archaeon]|nr:hypothetical protein [Candidatus Methanoperedenaceae archaeon]